MVPPVEHIDSRLRVMAERSDAVPLRANANLSFNGALPYGEGFLLGPDEVCHYSESNKANAGRIFKYLGGEDNNSHPLQSAGRNIISFDEMSLADAGRWPELLERVRRLVKPERDRIAEKHSIGRRRKELWWQFSTVAPALIQALPGHSR